MTTIDLIDIELESIKTRFTNEVLEREMRWIFKTFQDGANLTNIQWIYAHMISALRCCPHIIEEPLTLHNLSTVLSALTELSTKCWLISKGHFADLIEYTQTYNPLFFAAMVKMINAGKICIN
jgi:hypothetical protein